MQFFLSLYIDGKKKWVLLFVHACLAGGKCFHPYSLCIFIFYTFQNFKTILYECAGFLVHHVISTARLVSMHQRPCMRGTDFMGLRTNKTEVELVFVLQISSTVARAQVREGILHQISWPL